MAFADCNHSRRTDGAGQDKTVIIISMLADQVDPARRAHDEVGGVAKSRSKAGRDAIVQRLVLPRHGALR